MTPTDSENTTAPHTARELGQADSAAIIRFAAPIYPGGRHCLLCGDVTMGAVFPPVGNNPGRNPWAWRLFSFGANQARDGRAKDEQTAKGHLLAALVLTLSSAGLTFADPAAGAKAREGRDA